MRKRRGAGGRVCVLTFLKCFSAHSLHAIHTLPVSAVHVQSSKNNRFYRYYVMFGQNDRTTFYDKLGKGLIMCLIEL